MLALPEQQANNVTRLAVFRFRGVYVLKEYDN